MWGLLFGPNLYYIIIYIIYYILPLECKMHMTLSAVGTVAFESVAVLVLLYSNNRK
jgi:hypothetical protein